MKRRRVILIGVACLAAVVVAVLVWPAEREPEYQGKKLSEWLEPYNDVGDDGARVDAIKHIGTNALPFLLSWMQYEQPPWRVRIHKNLHRLPQVARKDIVYRVLLGEGELRLRGVVTGFEALGPEAAPAVLELSRMICQTNRVNRSSNPFHCLLSTGERGLLVVCDNLNSPDPQVRSAATNTLHRIADYRSANRGLVRQEGH